MSKWRFLRHLSLADNSMTALTAASLSPLTNTLQSLDLSANHFAEVPDCLAALTALRALNLSGCMIDSLRSLARSPLPAITVINLRGNRLQSLAGIERLLSLERIDLRDNQLNDPAEIARLTGIPNMTDVYVGRNPFTRTHSEYRITIFNLFRKTPGYVEDISIDGSPPSSSEKKLLVDRVPELPNVPVIRTEPEEEDTRELPVRERVEPVIEDFVDPFYEHRRSQDMLRQQRRKSDFGISNSQRRRRATRRRVVELIENDVRPEPTRVSSEFVTSASHRISTESVEPVDPQPKNSLTDDSTYGGSEVESTPVRFAKPAEDILVATPTSPPSQLPKIEANITPPLMRSGTETVLVAQSLFNTDSDAYRQRIASLKNDFGNGWLSAMSDEPWDNSNSTTFSPPLQPVRTPSQSMVSTGRTLG
jgi:Leucine-rich repeat (LRR) protein